MLKNKIIVIFVLINFFLLAVSLPTNSFEKNNTEKTFEIYANTANYSLNKKTIIFKGNISTNDGEFFIQANKLSILLDDNNKIIDIQAYEKITLNSKTIIAHCDSLFYNIQKKLIILMGNATLEYTLKDKSNLKTIGEKIIYNVETGLIEN